MTPPTELDTDTLELDRVQRGFEAYLRDGDGAELARALELVSPELMRIARYQGFRTEAAEDLVQATILVAIERARTFDPGRRVRPWLVGILLNKIAEARRAARRRRREREEDRDETRFAPGPLSMVESEEVQLLVSEALDHLPKKYREVLVPYLRDGKGGLEIAGDLDRPPGTIRAQIHRGLRLLRTMLPPSLALGGLLAFLARPVRAAGRGLGRLTRARWEVGSISVSAPPLLLGVTLVSLALGLWWALDRPSELRAADVTPPASSRSAALLSPGSLDDADRGAARIDTEAPPPVTLDPGTPVPATATGLGFRAIERLSREPVGGVELAVVLETRDGKIEHLEGITDPDGRWIAPFGKAEVERVVVDPVHPDYASFRAVWDTTLRALDTEVLLPLHHAVAVGGFVVDEDGLPLRGASVFLSLTELQEGVIWRRSERQLEARTDRLGFWRIDSASHSVSGRSLRVMHPSAAAELAFDERPTPPAAELRAFEARLVVRRSEVPPLTLRVRDPEGRPVPHAAVRIFPNALGVQREGTSLTADERGELSLRPEAIEQLMFAVHAPGFAPELGLARRPFPTHLDVHLGPPETTQVSVVDEEGTPQAAVRLRPLGSSWAEAVPVGPLGLARLELAADQTTWFEVRQSGVAGSVVRQVEPGADRELVLPTKASLRVNVSEAGSGKALSDYSLELLRGRRGKGVVGELHVTHAAPEEVVFFLPRARDFRVAVHRPGYRSVESGPFPADRPATFHGSLAPEDTVSLELQDVDGHACDYGLVVLLRPGMEARLKDGSAQPEDLRSKVFSNGEGSVTFTRPTGPYALAVTTRDGFALLHENEVRDGGTVRVEPWGSVAGVTAVEDGDVRLELRASYFEDLPDEPILRAQEETLADPQGRFRFSPLPPGQYVLTRHGADGTTTELEFELTAGESASVQL